MAVTMDLNLVRKQCRIDTTAEDDLLQGYVDAALAHVQQHCDRELVEGEPLNETQMNLTPDVQQAALLLIAHWAANREAVVTGEVPAAIQFGFERLLLYRKAF